MRRLAVPMAALLVLAACGDDPAAPTGERDGPGAPAPVSTPSTAPATASETEDPPDGTFAQAPDCEALPAEAAAICLRPVLAGGDPDPDLSVEMARLDVDRDGARDLILRRRSRNDCGPGGCSNFVLFERGGRFVLADPPINADGPAQPCLNDGEPGVRFPQAGEDAGCIALYPRP